MIRVALNGLAARKLRTALTALAIVLGVAMVSGAFTLTNSMTGAADSLSTASYDGTAAVVSAHTAFKASDEAEHPTIPASVLAEVRSTRGVGVAVGDVIDQAKIVGRDGKTTGTGPYFGTGFDTSTPGARKLSPFRLASGRFASGPGEVVIDAGTAAREHYRVGDRIGVQARGPVRRFRVVGIATFGSVKSIGTATFAIFDLRAAQDLFAKQGRYDNVLVGAAPGVSAAAVRTSLGTALPSSVRVQTAEANDRFTLDGLKGFVSFIRTVLLAFGGIAVFVGAFTIFNTLSITVAQRSRELALLRTMGSSRGQVLRSVLLEALIVGVVASVVGVIAGLGLAEGIGGLFASLGVDLPRTGVALDAHTVVVSMTVGVVVTLAAALAPALRATRVSPVQAMRDGTDLEPSRSGRRTPRIAIGATVLALGLLGAGMFAGGVSTNSRFALIAPGALVLFLAVAMVSPRLVPGLASVLGRPAQHLGGTAGALARRNAMRTPTRTAVTAAALMIGIALVVFVATLGAGLRQSTTGTLDRVITADYVVAATDGYSPIDPAAARSAAALPGVAVASSVAQDEGRAFGSAVGVNGVDPATIGRVYRYRWSAGGDDSLAALGAGGAIVSKAYAKQHHLGIGSRFSVTPPTGPPLRLVVRGIDDPPAFNPLNLGEVTVARRTFAAAFPSQRERFAFLDVDDGVTAASTRELTARLAGFPDTTVQTRKGFAEEQLSWLGDIVALFTVLLALTVIVSLFGIVNTLVLSVLERTRELGMLRAIGMSRRQVRRMIRHESVITALIGAVLGIAVGLFLAAMVTTALRGEGLEFAVPVGSLAAYAVVAVLAGIGAAVLPARRAARLDPLDALAYE